MIVLLGVLAAVGASYVGITARAAGSTRIYDGVLAKPERMVLVSAAALLVLLPVFLVIGAMIKLTDGGPIFFAQRFCEVKFTPVGLMPAANR